jgi:hypothetical protein
MFRRLSIGVASVILAAAAAMKIKFSRPSGSRGPSKW